VGRIRTWVAELLALHGTPQGVAGGFALGVGLSLIPIPFAGMLIALALAPVLKVNIPATYLGTAVVNPVTGAGFYAGELYLGLALMGRPLPSWAELKALDATGWWDLFTSMLGPFALGAAVAIPTLAGLSYTLVYLAVRQWRRTHEAAKEP
jgi:hypothetical protein